MSRRTALIASALPVYILLGCGGADGFAELGATDGSGGADTASGGRTSATGGKGSATGGTANGTGGAKATGGSPSTGGAPVETGGAPAGTGGTTPTPGDDGDYTFQTGHVTVPPGGEVFKCQDFPNPFGKDIGIVEMETDLTPGSHHMFAFVVSPAEATLTNGLVDCPAGGVEFHEYLTTSGSPKATTTYPAGVGRVFNGGTALRLNVHLLNTTPDAKDAFVTFKVKYVNPNTLENRAAAIFLNNVTVRVPPGESTATRSYKLTQDINMLGAASHMHRQGVHFVAKTDTGVTLYEGTEWAEPPIKPYTPPLHIAAGTTITWSCTYNNPTGKTLGFGESAETNEMCIFPGEFYNQSGQQISVQSIF